MAIVLIGTTKCKLCGKVFEAQDNIIAFAPLSLNEKDPLALFSDSPFHASCFYKHPLSGKALEREKEFMHHLGPGQRWCVVCDKEIEKPEEYFTLGFLTDDERHALYDYNYTQLHVQCLSQWEDLSNVCQMLEDYKKSGAWKGPALDWMLKTLTEHKAGQSEGA